MNTDLTDTDGTVNPGAKLKPDPDFKVERKAGSRLNDQSFENLLNLIGHCALETFDELIPFDDKTDQQKEDLLRVAMKSIEIAAVISCKFFDSETFEAEALAEIEKALKAKDYEKANALLGKM